MARRGSKKWVRDIWLTPQGDSQGAHTIGRGNQIEKAVYETATATVACTTKYKNYDGRVTRTCPGTGIKGQPCNKCGYIL